MPICQERILPNEPHQESDFPIIFVIFYWLKQVTGPTQTGGKEIIQTCATSGGHFRMCQPYLCW